MARPLLCRVSTARLSSWLEKANTHKSRVVVADRMWRRRREREVSMPWASGQVQGLGGKS